MSENIIEVKNLTKKYGKLLAVNNISFEVQKGEVFALLGENGPVSREKLVFWVDIYYNI